MIWHEKTYRKGRYEVHVGPNGEIKVRPGDTLWGYSMAIYGNYYNINKFARYQGKLLLPIKKMDKIFAGETIYHIETYLYGSTAPAARVSVSRPGARIQPPPTPSKAEGTAITVEWIIEQHPELASKRELLQKAIDDVGVDYGETISKIVEVLKGVGKFIKFIKGVTPLDALLTMLTVPLQILATAGEAGLLAVRWLGEKAYAYGITWWAFEGAAPAASASDLQHLRMMGGGDRRLSLARETWEKMLKAGAKAMDNICLEEGIPIKYGKILLRAKYDNDPKKLAHAIYTTFERGLKPTEQEAHRTLRCDYPD